MKDGKRFLRVRSREKSTVFLKLYCPVSGYVFATVLKGIFYSVLIMQNSISRVSVMLLDSPNETFRHKVFAKMKKPTKDGV